MTEIDMFGTSWLSGAGVTLPAALYELVYSEQTYVKKLGQMQELYRCLHDAIPAPILAKIFSNSAALLSINTTFLKKLVAMLSNHVTIACPMVEECAGNTDEASDALEPESVANCISQGSDPYPSSDAPMPSSAVTNHVGDETEDTTALTDDSLDTSDEEDASSLMHKTFSTRLQHVNDAPGKIECESSSDSEDLDDPQDWELYSELNDPATPLTGQSGSVISDPSSEPQPHENVSIYRVDEGAAAIVSRSGSKHDSVLRSLLELFAEELSIFQTSYSLYVCQYTEAKHTLETDVMKKPHCAELIAVAIAGCNSNGLTLEDYLMEPVQRVTRYRMLFTNLLKEFPESKTSREIVEALSQLANEVNECIKRRDNYIKLVAVSKKVYFESTSRFQLVQLGRKFIYADFLKKVCRRAHKRFMFYLFNDIFFYTPPNGVCRRIYYINECTINETCTEGLTGSGATFPANSFVIHGPGKSFVVYADSEDSKNKWITHFASCINPRTSKRMTVQDVAAVWIPDHCLGACSFCSANFTLARRRHHCRNCGALVCSKCSPMRFLLPNVSATELVRICNKCYELLALGGGLAESESSPQPSARSRGSSEDTATSRRGTTAKKEHMRLFEIQNAIVNKRIELVKDGRSLIKEGQLKKVCRKGSKEFRFFIFNDCLVYAREITDGKLWLHRVLPIAGTRLVEGVGEESCEDPQLAMQVISSVKSFTVVMGSVEEKQEWAEALRHSEWFMGNNQGTDKRHSLLDEKARSRVKSIGGNSASCITECAPVWERDDSRKQCPHCETAFSMSNRRHHCRRCGGLTCGPCSSKKALLPHSAKPKRVCVRCYSELHNQASPSSGIGEFKRDGACYRCGAKARLWRSHTECHKCLRMLCNSCFGKETMVVHDKRVRVCNDCFHIQFSVSQTEMA